MHEGEALKRLIFEKDLEVVDVAKKSKISRMQIYLMYKMEVIPEKYYPKLLKAGIDLSLIKRKQAKTILEAQAEVLLWQAKYEQQRERNEKLQDTIILLTNQLKKKK